MSIVVLFMLAGTFSCDESEPEQIVEMHVITATYVEEDPVKESKIEVFVKNKLVTKVYTDNDGDAFIQVPAGQKSKIVVSKKGMVKRFFLVDLRRYTRLKKENKIIGACQISLFESWPGEDYSYITENPITTFYQKGGEQQLSYDAETGKNMMDYIANLTQFKKL